MARIPKYARCRLCGSHAPLRESHIFPKFYWEWMKATGDHYFRDPRRPNLRLQDGSTLKMLCTDCEVRFSRFETPFADRVFKPLMADPCAPVQYEAFALRLLISVLWRNLALDLDTANSPHQWRAELAAVEIEWRQWLLDRGELARFGRVHLFVTDLALPESPQYNLYLTRSADATPMWTDERLLAYYVKFGKLIVCAEISPLHSEKWVNTLISADAGTIAPGSMSILDGSFGNFISDRARRFEAYRRQGIAGMSPRQREKVKSRFEQNLARLANSEMSRALASDWAWNKSTLRVGRNEPCPCGSGVKYKRCHGR